jgi:hypothetical protein
MIGVQAPLGNEFLYVSVRKREAQSKNLTFLALHFEVAD